MKVVELFVCKGRWGGACDPKSTDTSDGGFKRVRLGVFDRTNAELQWSGVNIICGDGSLDGVGMEGNAGWRLMSGLRIRAGVCGVHDVVYSGGNVWNRDGRGLKLYGCVSGSGVRTIPGAMVIKVLNGRKR